MCCLRAIANRLRQGMVEARKGRVLINLNRSPFAYNERMIKNLRKEKLILFP